MNIIGTEKIKGVVEIPCLNNRQLTKGQRLTITDSEFNHSEVQAALKMGWIRKEEGNEQVGSPTKMIRCRNNSNQPMRLHCVTDEIAPNAYFEIRESDLSNGDIKKARASLLIEIEESVDKQEITEKKITIKKEPKKITTDTNEEIHINSNQIKTDKVIFNPNGDQVIVDKKPNTSAKEVNKDVNTFDRNDEVNPNINDPKTKPVVHDPLKTKSTNEIENATIWKPKQDEVIFVDEQAEKAKIASHPKLSKSKTKKVVNSPFVDDPKPQNSELKIEEI